MGEAVEECGLKGKLAAWGLIAGETGGLGSSVTGPTSSGAWAGSVAYRLCPLLDSCQQEATKTECVECVGGCRHSVGVATM